MKTNAQPDLNAKYLRRPEAATYLSISLRQLDELKAVGEIPFVYLGRRLVRFKRQDLDEYMEKHRVVL